LYFFIKFILKTKERKKGPYFLNPKFLEMKKEEEKNEFTIPAGSGSLPTLQPAVVSAGWN
jgi:hypothetical protein